MLGDGAWPGRSGKSEEKKKQIGVRGDGGGRGVCDQTQRVRKVTKQLCVCAQHHTCGPSSLALFGQRGFRVAFFEVDSNVGRQNIMYTGPIPNFVVHAILVHASEGCKSGNTMNVHL